MFGMETNNKQRINTLGSSNDLTDQKQEIIGLFVIFEVDIAVNEVE